TAHSPISSNPFASSTTTAARYSAPTKDQPPPKPPRQPRNQMRPTRRFCNFDFVSYSLIRCLRAAMVAVVQLVEHQVVILGVAGSSPVSHPDQNALTVKSQDLR